MSSSTISTVASSVSSATSTNTANTIVKRDGSGGFAAGTIKATAITSGTLSLTTPLSVSSGGTGTNSSTGTGSVVLSTSPSLTGTPTAITANSSSNSTQIATTAFVTSKITGASTPDATETIKGKLQLTNDLGGTAALPTVNSVGGVKSSTISTFDTRITTLNTKVTSNTISITNIGNELDLKLYISDTSDMLTKRIGRDTISLSNRIDAIKATHYLGESFGGGIIVYLESDKQHGLIAATQDGNLSNGGGTHSLLWGGNTVDQSGPHTGASKDGLYAGKLNTERIVSRFFVASGDRYDYAATFISNLIINTYGDWYLPSLAELRIVFAFNNANSNILNMSSGPYWSSTENTNQYACTLTNTGIQQNQQRKGTLLRIRAIRSF